MPLLKGVMPAGVCRAGGADFFEISLLKSIRSLLNALQTFAGKILKHAPKVERVFYLQDFKQ